MEAFLGTHTDLDLMRLTILNGYTSQNISVIQTTLVADKNKVLTQNTLKEEAGRKLEAHRLAKHALKEDDTVELL